jgi:hypothetical protein
VTYYPLKVEPVPEKCPGCGKWHIRVQNISCCVMHPPGTCCHMGEQEVPEPQRWRATIKRLWRRV